MTEEPVVTEEPAAGEPVAEEPAAEVPDVITEVEESSKPAQDETESEPAEQEMQNAEPQDIPIAEYIDLHNPDRKVIIYANLGGREEIFFGDTVAFSAELVGYEGLTYKLIWQYSASGGSAWNDIGDATGSTYSLVLNEENISWHLRVAVEITGLSE